MSITLSHSPENYIRAYDTNSCYYKISSTNVAQTNFKFVVKIYNGATLLTTIKLLPDSSGYGYYNPTSFINNYLTSDISTSTALTTCPNSMKTISFNFSEEYGDPIVSYTGATNSTKYFYNGCQIYENYDALYTNAYWLMKSGSTIGHFLTVTDKFYLDTTEKMYLYFISADAMVATMTFDFYNGTTSLGDVTYSLTCSANTMYHIGAGPANLPTGSTPINWTYYTININNISEDYVGSAYTYVYNKAKCNYNDWTDVYWLNEHGGWSNFIFNKRKYKDYKIKRDVYNKWIAYGDTNSRGTSQYLTTIDDITTLNTDWINDYQNLLIKSLLESPDVRVLENGVYRNYVVLDTEYSEKNTKDEGLYSYQIKITSANKKIIQRG